MSENGGEVVFNQAAYLMRRIDEIESRLDKVNTNPLAKYAETGNQYGFQIMIQDLESLLAAISPTLKTKEIEECISLRQELNRCLNKHPMFINTSYSPSGNNPRYSLNRSNWTYLKEYIFNLRLKLESLIDEKGMGNVKKQNPSSAIIN